MANNTIPNIIVLPDTVTDIYANAGVVAAGVVVGDQINIDMIGQGLAELYSGPSAPVAIDNSTGFVRVKNSRPRQNDAGDLGAFIYSRLGCTINVQKVV